MLSSSPSDSGARMFAMPRAAPSWLVGLWRREAMEYPDGRRDTATEVVWGQTSRLFVDLRIPSDRPATRGRRSFDDYSLDELQRLAEQKGFAGHIVMAGDVCTWERSIDYRPPTGRPDRGRLRVVGDTLYEEGDASSIVASSYREIYHRQPAASRPSASLQLLSHQRASATETDCTGAILVFVDDSFLFARDRPRPLPAAETLRALIADAGGDRRLILDYLDCEISLGPMSDAGLIVSRSTLPFRESRRLFDAGDAKLIDDGTAIAIDGTLGRLEWRIVETTIPADRLAALLRSA